MRLVYLAFGWVSGIVLAASNPDLSSRLALAWLALCGLALLSVWLLRDWQRWPALALLALTLGGLRMALVPGGSELARYNNLGGVSIEGIVSAAPELRDSGAQLRVSANTLIQDGARLPVSGMVLVQSVQGRSVRHGDRVRATGLLLRPWTFDSFSWSDQLARSGVFSIMREASLQVLASDQSAPLPAALTRLSERAGQHVTHYLPDPQAALLKGILLGNESGLSPAIRQAFNDTGATHVIAISGFNMIILSGAVMALLRRTQLPPSLAAFIGTLAILLYAMFVGANAPVLRAALMSSLLVIASAIRRRVFAPTSLAAAIMLMSLESPTVLWDVGFQLSVFATLGIMLFVAPFGAGLQRALNFMLSPGAGRRVGDLLAEPLVVSLAAQIATLPLILRYFERLSLVSLPVNLLIIPAQAPLLILGFLATATAFVAPLPAQLLFWLDLLPLTWTTEIVQAAASLPFAAGELPVDSRLVAGFYAALVAASILQAGRFSWATRLAQAFVRHTTGSLALLLTLGLALLLGAARLSQADGMLHLWLLDVGHSNAVLLQGPGGEHILIDGGRASSRLLTTLGERLPFHDQRIEVLALSTMDPEANDALDALLQRYKIGLLVHNGQREPPPQLVEAADESLILGAGHTLEFGDGLLIEVLHPQARPARDQRLLNTSALVLRIRYDRVSFLLPANLDRAGQQAMLTAGVSPQATVLQLPQHGAARSLDGDFLQAVAPQLIMVHTDPDDPRNQRSDPNPDIVAMLDEIPLVRSDAVGALHLWSDGERLWRDVLPKERVAG